MDLQTDTHINPTQRYHHDLERSSFVADPAQEIAVSYTQSLYEQLMEPEPVTGMWKKLFSQTLQPVRGLYFYGKPGRGKTWLVDGFYDCLPFKEKHRIHFHQFMRDIHHQLKELPKSPDPLKIVAENIAKKYRVLCLDEFHVHDIADAMLLAGLLKALFDNGVILVATSNTAIDNLYKNGLQRERFMYAIKLLQQHTIEVMLDGDNDYRLSQLIKNSSYSVLPSEDMQVKIDNMFDAMAPSKAKHDRQIIINDRTIDYRALADDVIWFDFNAICNTPRSAHDYLEIAQIYHTVFLSNLYQLQEAHDSIAKRFIHLVDALYDHNVKLIIVAEVEMSELYHGRKQTDEFMRTFSRLHEMGGKSYLAKPHVMR